MRRQSDHMDTVALSRARRQMVLLVSVAALAMTLAACHTTRVVWSKPDADQAELQADLAACGKTVHVAAVNEPSTREAAIGNDIPATATHQQVSCMLKRGWRLTPLPS